MQKAKINIGRFLRIVLCAILVIASISKLISPGGFFEFMRNMGYESSFVDLYIISFIELVLGIIILIGLYRRVSYMSSALLFLIFVAIHIYALINNIPECGCTGGLLFNKIGYFSIFFNGFLFLASVYLTLIYPPDILEIDSYLELKDQK